MSSVGSRMIINNVNDKQRCFEPFIGLDHVSFGETYDYQTGFETRAEISRLHHQNQRPSVLK